jgi:hypothetical protein
VQLKRQLLEPYLIVINALINEQMPDENDDREFSIPTGTVWQLGRIKRVMAPMFEQLVEDYKDLFNTMATEGTDPPTIAEENVEEFRSRLDAMLQETVECPHTLKVSDFANAVNVPGALLDVIHDLIIEG